MCFTPMWLPLNIRDYSSFRASIGTTTLLAVLRQRPGTSIQVMGRELWADVAAAMSVN